MDFLKKANKNIEKAGVGIGAEAAAPPRYWFSSGNYVLNKILSGNYRRFTPQGRILALCGPSGSGKSFILSNAMREAQHGGAFCVVLDSENALDNNFVKAIDVDITGDNYHYYSVNTMDQAKLTLSAVIEGYKKEFGSGNMEAPPMYMGLDSLDMLITKTEEEQFKVGKLTGDMGQRNKQQKAFLRELVQAIKHENISLTITSQGYKNQDISNGEGWWIIAEAIRFSLSQIVLLGKRKWKDKNDKSIIYGINMVCEGFKTRFTKPFQTVTLQVPYDTGMDPYNGLLDVAVNLDVVKKNGAWYNYKGNSFYAKDFGGCAEDVLKECEAKEDAYLDAGIDISEIVMDDNTSSRSKREKKIKEEEDTE